MLGIDKSQACPADSQQGLKNELFQSNLSFRKKREDMIYSFRMLGKSILQAEGYYDEPEEIGKRKIFLKHQSIPASEKKGKEEPEHAIALNFDTQKREFRFELDRQITPAYRDYFFAFKVGSSRDKKKFLSTNSVSVFYKKIFTESLEYINKKRKGKTKKCFTDISDIYDAFLTELQEIFYVKEEKNYVLNKELLRTDQKQVFDKLETEFPKAKAEELYDRLLNQKFFNRSSKDNQSFPQIALIKIDSRHILEYEDYKKSYINLVYYDLFERFFVENGKKDKICHICQSRAETIGEVPLPMKFYGATNELYFENLKKKNAYKSFSICRDCLAEVLTGMRHIENELRNYLLGISVYLIPSFEEAERQFERKYKRIFNLLKANKSYKEDIDEINNLVKKSEKKDFAFSLLFFDKQKNAFDILKLITNIEYKKLVEKLGYFDDFRKAYDLALLNQSFTLNDVRRDFFPSEKSHNAKDIRKLYRKDILNFLEAFLHGYSISYADMVGRFTDICNRRFHRDNGDVLAPFKAVLFFSILNNIKPLKGMAMTGGNAVTEVQNEDFQKFFETHEAIYKENYYRQGLFLLGTAINNIVAAQQKKASAKDGGGEGDEKKKGKRKKASSTFLKKLNYSGIPTRRVRNLLAEVKDYTEIYDEQIYNEPGIWGNIMDRLQGIENSGMKGEEVIFYILTGISYAGYLGMIHAKKEKGGK